MTTRASVLALIAVLAGCGSGGGGATTPPPAPQAADGTVSIEDFKFLPEDLAVDAGTTVTWTNEDDAPHTATADDGSFDTGTLRRGDEGAVTLDEAGTFTYVCEFHKFMRAKITVR